MFCKCDYPSRISESNIQSPVSSLREEPGDSYTYRTTRAPPGSSLLLSLLVLCYDPRPNEPNIETESHGVPSYRSHRHKTCGRRRKILPRTGRPVQRLVLGWYKGRNDCISGLSDLGFALWTVSPLIWFSPSPVTLAHTPSSCDHNPEVRVLSWLSGSLPCPLV